MRSHRRRCLLDEILSAMMVKVLTKSGSMTVGHGEAVDFAGWGDRRELSMGSNGGRRLCAVDVFASSVQSMWLLHSTWLQIGLSKGSKGGRRWKSWWLWVVMERSIGPKVITLILMMINSCSNSTNNLMLFKF